MRTTNGGQQKIWIALSLRVAELFIGEANLRGRAKNCEPSSGHSRQAAKSE